jgi:hypothetical protein
MRNLISVWTAVLVAFLVAAGAANALQCSHRSSATELVDELESLKIVPKELLEKAEIAQDTLSAYEQVALAAHLFDGRLVSESYLGSEGSFSYKLFTFKDVIWLKGALRGKKQRSLLILKQGWCDGSCRDTGNFSVPDDLPKTFRVDGNDDATKAVGRDRFKRSVGLGLHACGLVGSLDGWRRDGSKSAQAAADVIDQQVKRMRQELGLQRNVKSSR